MTVVQHIYLIAGNGDSRADQYAVSVEERDRVTPSKIHVVRGNQHVIFLEPVSRATDL